MPPALHDLLWAPPLHENAPPGRFRSLTSRSTIVHLRVENGDSALVLARLTAIAGAEKKKNESYKFFDDLNEQGSRVLLFIFYINKQYVAVKRNRNGLDIFVHIMV